MPIFVSWKKKFKIEMSLDFFLQGKRLPLVFIYFTSTHFKTKSVSDTFSSKLPINISKLDLQLHKTQYKYSLCVSCEYGMSCLSCHGNVTWMMYWLFIRTQRSVKIRNHKSVWWECATMKDTHLLTWVM